MAAAMQPAACALLPPDDQTAWLTRSRAFTAAPPLHAPCAHAGGSAAGLQLMKRAASAGMLLAPFPLGKRPCLEYMHLAAAAHHDQLLHHPPGPMHPGGFPGAAGGGAGAGPHGGTYYATPEIVPVPLLAPGGGSGPLPPLRREGVAGAPVFEEMPQHNGNPTVHGGGGFMQQLAGNSEAELFGELFPGGGDAGAGAAAAGHGSQSPRDQQPGRRDGSGVLPPLAGGMANGGMANGGGYLPQSPHDRREGSAENKEVGVWMDGLSWCASDAGQVLTRWPVQQLA